MADGTRPRGAAAQGEPVLDRAFRILAAFGPAHRALSLAALSARAGLPKPTALRLARKLVQWGAWNAPPTAATSSGCGCWRWPRWRRAGTGCGRSHCRTWRTCITPPGSMCCWRSATGMMRSWSTGCRHAVQAG